MRMIHVLPDDRECAVRLESGDLVLRPRDFRGLSIAARAYDLRRLFASMRCTVYITTGARVFNRGEVKSLFRAASWAAGEVGLDVYASEDLEGPYRLMISGGKIIDE